MRTYSFSYKGWNDKIVSLVKMTLFHIRFMKAGFLLLLQTIYLLASCVQIPRAIGAFYHVWKLHNVQRARSEMRRYTTHVLNWSKLWQQDNCQHPQNANPNEGYIMPPHIFEVGLKVNTKVYLDVLKSVVISWCNQVAGGRRWVWQQDAAPAHKSKETQAWLPKECYDFVPFSHLPPPPPTWIHWTTLFGHTSRRSQTWPPTTTKPAWSPPSAEYSPIIRRAPAGACGKACSQFRIRIEAMIEADGGCNE